MTQTSSLPAFSGYYSKSTIIQTQRQISCRKQVFKYLFYPDDETGTQGKEPKRHIWLFSLAEWGVILPDLSVIVTLANSGYLCESMNVEE